VTPVTKRKKNGKIEDGQKPSTGLAGIRVYSRISDREIGRETVGSPKAWKTALGQLLSKQTSDTDLVAYFVPDSTSFLRIATADWARKLVESDLENYIAEDLSWRLSTEDHRLFREYGLDVPDAEAQRRIHQALDKVIKQAALDQGPIIFLHPTILQRVIDWAVDEKDNGRRWTQLGKQFALIGPVMRGQKKAPLDSWWVQAQKGILKEVKALQRVLHERFGQTANVPSERVLADAVLDAMAGAPEVFPKLTLMTDNFHQFLGAQPLALRNLLTAVISPGAFRNELIAWITNRKPESARQTMSKLRQ
jgi:hypothetical protein